MHTDSADLIRAYPNVIDVGWNPENELIINEVVKEVPPNKRVLDVGCNSGWLMTELRDKKGCSVVGVEPADGPRAAAQAKGLEVHDAWAEHLPFEGGSFDVVIASTVLQQVEDVEPVTRELRRVCAGDGVIIGVNPTLDGEWGEFGIDRNRYVRHVLPEHLFGYYFPGTMTWRIISKHNYVWRVTNPDAPSVSIGVVMPVVNCLKYTQQTVNSFVCLNPYELIVIDNGDDDTGAWLSKVDRPIVYCKQESNIGVSRSWNLGMTLAFSRGHKFVFVINNDIVFAPDTFSNLARWLTPNTPFVTVHNIGNDPTMLYRHTRLHTALPAPNFIGFLTTQTMVQRVGLFDEEYELGYFEDLDYHYRIAAEELTAMSCCDAVVAHYGSRAIKEGGVDHIVSWMKNRDRFQKKWGFIP